MSYRLVPCDETCHEKDTENGYVTPSEFHWEETSERGCELGECDKCATTYDIGSQLDHCTECGTCWDHCKGAH